MTTVVQRLGDTQGARNTDGMFRVFRVVSTIANEHITMKVSVSGHFPWRILCNFSRPLSRGRSPLVSLLRGCFGIKRSNVTFRCCISHFFFFVQFGV